MRAWAGFVNDKLSWLTVRDVRGVAHTLPAIFILKTEAEESHEDVRRVEITELKGDEGG